MNFRNSILISTLVCLFLPCCLNYSHLHAQGDAGIIAVEAEHALACQGWRMVSGHSGKAMQDDSERGQGWLRFELKFDQPGRYFMYLLCLAPDKNTSKNDCYVYLDEKKLHAIGEEKLRPDGIRVHTADYSWSGLPKGPGPHTPSAIRDNGVYFEVREPGTHTLQIVSRSMGFTVDKIVLKLNNQKAPEGAGPAENGLAYAPPVRVGKWDRFEARLQTGRNYPDPFRDLQVKSRFYAPSGRTIAIRGFYDGNQAWKVRCMPDETGIWEYEIYSSDSALRRSGQFECVNSDIPGLISVYEHNPIWFGFIGGNPLLVRSLHIGDRFFASRDNEKTGEKWSENQRTEFLDWCQSQGYNMLSIASHYLNRQQENRGLGWNTPDLWRAGEELPDPEEYRRLESILDDLHQRKILVYPFAGFFGRGSNFPTNPESRDLFIEYTMSRLGAYPNLLFNVGGPEPRLRNRPYLSMQEIDTIARKIKEEDVHGHLLSIHNYTGDDLFIDHPWNDYGILQGPKTTDLEKLSQIILQNHHPGRPLYLQETLWSGNQYHPAYTLEDVRKNALVILLAGGAINYGDMNGNSSSGFSGTIDFSNKVQERHDAIHAVWDLFETFPWYEMKPRPDLVSSGYCLATEGKRYLVYFAGSQTVDIQLIPGAYTGKWISVENFSRVFPIKEISHKVRFSPPDGKGDWLLYISRK